MNEERIKARAQQILTAVRAIEVGTKRIMNEDRAAAVDVGGAIAKAKFLSNDILADITGDEPAADEGEEA